MPDQSTRDLYDEIATLRQEVVGRDATIRELERMFKAERDSLRTAARHVVDCYRRGNLMAVIVGVDTLAGMVET